MPYAPRLALGLFLLPGISLLACTSDDASGQDELGETDAGSSSDESGSETGTDTATDTSSETGEPPADSHGKGPGNYDLVFDDTVVRRMDITIATSDYDAMMANLETLYGGGGMGFPDEDPIYVPVTVDYEDETWSYVGMRFKGNSTLRNAYMQGNGKLPFRLHFDKYEDEHPEILDQRFWGFKELKFGSSAMDGSVIRDKLGSELFRAAGVPASKGAFIRVFVDVGDGPIYWGLYTMFEDPCGGLLDGWFGSDTGNCYKPDGGGASWDSLDLSVFEKQTNEDLADFSDIEATYAALHATNDGAAWREQLDASFDVDAFLRYLALNNLIQNWDSYGVMTHNYYLYGDPANGNRLVWIPWDNNEAFHASQGMMKTVLSLGMDEVGSNWPMIRFLMDDPVYAAQYYDHLADLTATTFQPDSIEALAQQYHDLIEPYVVGAEGEIAGYGYTNETSFASSIDSDIVPVVTARYEAALALLP